MSDGKVERVKEVSERREYVMINAPVSSGGVDLFRGLEHQRAATIFHLLVRWHQYPDASATIESLEDATIAYTNPLKYLIVEDIQCKKVEDGQANPLSIAMDDWWATTLTRGKLKEWVEESRQGFSSVSRLAEFDNLYLTVLAYAEPSRPLLGYVPPGVVTSGWTRHGATTDYFPAEYTFPQDPDPNARFGTISVRQKIRLVPLGPPQLHIYSMILLRKLYGVLGSKTPDAFDAIESLLYGHIWRKPEKRTFHLADIQNAIQPYCSTRAKWLDVRTAMESEFEQNDKWRSQPNPERVPIVRWSDFRDGRFIKTEYLTEAADVLGSHNFVVLSGYNGAGKTTIAKFLARAYLNENPGSQCFYLRVSPGEDLADELEYLKTNYHRKILFVIDDGHFSGDAVNAIAQWYLEFGSIYPVEVKLVIAMATLQSSETGRVGAYEALQEGHQIRLDFISASKMGVYLQAYQAYQPLKKTVPDREISRIAGGGHERVNFGVALCLAHSR
jgi:hypothetical protein